MIKRILILLISFSSFNFYAQNFSLNDTIFQIEDVLVYSVLFNFNGDSILASNYQFLDSLSNFLIKNDSLIIEVGSHRDTRGRDNYSTNITQARAVSIADYLINKELKKID